MSQLKIDNSKSKKDICLQFSVFKVIIAGVSSKRTPGSRGRVTIKEARFWVAPYFPDRSWAGEYLILLPCNTSTYWCTSSLGLLKTCHFSAAEVNLAIQILWLRDCISPACRFLPSSQDAIPTCAILRDRDGKTTRKKGKNKEPRMKTKVVSRLFNNIKAIRC